MKGSIMKGWNKLLLIVSIILMIPMVALYGLKFFLDAKIKSKYSQEQLKRLDELKTKKVSVKSAAPIVIKNKKSLNDLMKELSDEYTASGVKDYFNLYYSYNKPQENKDKIDKEMFENLKKIEPLIEKLKAVVDSPDYNLDCANQKEIPAGPSGIPGPNFLPLQNAILGLTIQAKWFCSQRRYEEAFINAEYIIRASKTDLYSRNISNFIAINFYAKGAVSWYDSVLKYDDLNLLKKTFEKQKELKRDSGFILRDIDMQIVDYIGNIRAAERLGIDVDYENKTGLELFAESFRVEAEYMEKFVMPNLTDPEDLKIIKRMIENYRMASAVAGGKAIGLKPVLIKIIGPFIRNQLIVLSNPNEKEALTRDDVALTKYNLMIVETAKKIYELENNKDIENISDLVPDYLSEIPEDIFNDSKFPLIYDKEIFSIGPDKNDNEAQILYDPTNGTRSPGDIYLMN